MYTEEVGTGTIIPVGTGVLAADVLTAAAVHGEWMFLKRYHVRRLMVAISTLTAGDEAAVITFWRRPTPGSTTGQVSLGTITVPSGTAVGKIIYKNIDPATMEAGDALAVEVTTAASGGTPAGGAYYGFECYLDPEDARNEGDMVLSV